MTVFKEMKNVTDYVANHNQPLRDEIKSLQDANLLTPRAMAAKAKRDNAFSKAREAARIIKGDDYLHLGIISLLGGSPELMRSLSAAKADIVLSAIDTIKGAEKALSDYNQVLFDEKLSPADRDERNAKISKLTKQLFAVPTEVSQKLDNGFELGAEVTESKFLVMIGRG